MEISYMHIETGFEFDEVLEGFTFDHEHPEYNNPYHLAVGDEVTVVQVGAAGTPDKHYSGKVTSFDEHGAPMLQDAETGDTWPIDPHDAVIRVNDAQPVFAVGESFVIDHEYVDEQNPYGLNQGDKILYRAASGEQFQGAITGYHETGAPLFQDMATGDTWPMDPADKVVSINGNAHLKEGFEFLTEEELLALDGGDGNYTSETIA